MFATNCKDVTIPSKRIKRREIGKQRRNLGNHLENNRYRKNTNNNA